MLRRRLLMLALAAAAMAGPALAQTQQKPPTFTVPPPKLRGPVAPTTTPTPARPTRQPDQSLDPSLVPPIDNAARLGGLEQERAGGALCRQACSQTYYFCLANEEAQSCAASWTSCLTACPTNSSRQ